MDLEQYKCELEKWKTETQSSMVIYQQVNLQGQAAMKAAMLINGGASVAMLAFIGTTLGNTVDSDLLLKLCNALLIFSAGVLVTAFAFGTTYLAGLSDSNESNDTKDKQNNWWKILNTITICLVIVGYIAFIAGLLKSYIAFTSQLL